MSSKKAFTASTSEPKTDDKPAASSKEVPQAPASSVAAKPAESAKSVEEKPAQKSGLLAAAKSTASTTAASSTPASPAKPAVTPAPANTGFFEHSDDNAIILPLDDFDTLFGDLEQPS